MWFYESKSACLSVKETLSSGYTRHRNAPFSIKSGYVVRHFEWRRKDEIL